VYLEGGGLDASDLNAMSFRLEVPRSSMADVMRSRVELPETSMAVLQRTPVVQHPALSAVSLVCVAAVAPYLSTLGGYFIGDDFGLVQLFRAKAPLHFVSLFTRPWTDSIYGSGGDELRPILALSYQLDAFWGASSSISFHSSNIAFHLINAVLVLAIARRIARLTWPASTFAGVLFAVMPVQAETVAWISGRADSLPAFFYVGSFLGFALWRRTGSARCYWLGVLVFFLALFSKQYAITMLATLVLYDVLVEHRGLASWSTYLRSYAPFIVLTCGYLGLRYVLFGSFAREDRLPILALVTAIPRTQVAQQLVLIFGSAQVVGTSAAVRLAVGVLGTTALAVTLIPAYFEVRRPAPTAVPTTRGLLLYFGPVWWIISVVPLVVTYTSPRHLYLASVGLSLSSALILDAIRRGDSRRWRKPGLIAGLALLTACLLRLESLVGDWTTSARISEKITRDLQLQAASAVPGSLLIVGAPDHALPERGGATWLWSFALPFAAQPPFVPEDLDQRVAVIEPPEVYCCPPGQWFAATHDTLARWSGERDRPVVVLVWNASTGALLEQSDADNTCLRPEVSALAGTGSADEMSQRLRSILAQAAAPPPACQLPAR
jgi:hypothetical protein